MKKPIFEAKDFDCLGIGLGYSPSEENIASIANDRLDALMKCERPNGGISTHVVDNNFGGDKCLVCGKKIFLVAEGE